MSFFLELNVGSDVEYGLLHAPEHVMEVEARAHIDALWLKSAGYLDANVREAAQYDLIGRYWELYLASVLLDSGLELVPTTQRDLSRGGPDFQLSAPHAYVEAIVARPGEGPDKVAKPENFVVRSVPRTEITLRIRAAIAAKYLKYQAYLAAGVLASTDPFVIAINGSRLPSTRGEPDPPWIIGAVFPIGNRVVHLDAVTFEVTGESFEHEPILVKQSGAPVSKDIFLDKSHEGVSAVIYCWADPCNRVTRPGCDFIVVHNPHAANPLPRGALPCGIEAWLEGGNVKLHREHGAV